MMMSKFNRRVQPIQKKDVDRKNNMSIQNQLAYTPQKPTLNRILNEKVLDKLEKIVHDSIQNQRYHQLVQNPVKVAGVDDPKALLCVQLTASTSIRKRHVVFKNSNYIISDWLGDQFPNVLYISVDGVNGYMQKVGQNASTISTKLAALELVQITAVLDDSQQKRYQLRYQIKDPVAWQVPLTLEKLVFRIYADDQATSVVLPLPNPLTLNFEYRRQ